MLCRCARMHTCSIVVFVYRTTNAIIVQAPTHRLCLHTNTTGSNTNYTARKQHIFRKCVVTSFTCFACFTSSIFGGRGELLDDIGLQALYLDKHRSCRHSARRRSLLCHSRASSAPFCSFLQTKEGRGHKFQDMVRVLPPSKHDPGHLPVSRFDRD